MEALGKYILSITAASILYAVIRSLLGKKGGSAALVQLIGGLFLTFTVISPVADINFDDILEIPWEFSAEADAAATQGQAVSQKQMEGIIKSECESYILDKALSYGAQLEVEVTLTEDPVPVPSAVQMHGNVSSYTKRALQDWLQTTMGIPKENQRWTE